MTPMMLPEAPPFGRFQGSQVGEQGPGPGVFSVLAQSQCASRPAGLPVLGRGHGQPEGRCWQQPEPGGARGMTGSFKVAGAKRLVC